MRIYLATALIDIGKVTAALLVLAAEAGLGNSIENWVVNASIAGDLFFVNFVKFYEVKK